MDNSTSHPTTVDIGHAHSSNLDDIPLSSIQLLNSSSIPSTFDVSGKSTDEFRGTNTIAKRRKAAIIIGACVVVTLLALGIGLVAGMREKNKSSGGGKSAPPPSSLQSSSEQQQQAQAPQQNTGTSQAPVQNSLLGNYKGGLTIDWKAVHDETLAINPAAVQKFFTEVKNLTTDTGVEFPPVIISRESLIMMLREVRGDMYPVWEMLSRYARLEIKLKDLDQPTRFDLAKNVSEILAKPSINRWGFIIADRHAKTAATGEVASMQDLAILARANKEDLPLSLPEPTTPPGTPSPSTATDPIGRRLLAAAPLWKFPETCIPVVFHVLQYAGPTDKEYQPPLIHANFTHMVHRLNLAFANGELPGGGADTRIRFYLKDVRTAIDHGYLRMTSAEDWNNCWADNKEAGGKWLFKLAGPNNVDVSGNINVWVCGLAAGRAGESCLDTSNGGSRCPPGYAWVPQEKQPDGAGSENWANSHIHMLWDNVDERLDGNPDGLTFHRGGWHLAHFVAHHLGLWHTHDGTTPCVKDGDIVTDTPVTQMISQQSYFADLVEMCDTWRQEMPWPHRGAPWTSSMGIPLTQCRSCSKLGPYDPVFNVMSFTAPSCTSHFTLGQVQRIWYSMMAYRPTMLKQGTSLTEKARCAASSA